MQQSIYEAVGGQQAFLDLAAAWHARCLADPVVSHAFSHPGQHPQHVERLAAYWAEALGGPPEYSASMGDESLVQRLHAGMGEHAEMDERAQVCFAQALDDVGLPGDPSLRQSLKDYFRWATGVLAMHPVSADGIPADLPIAAWSWNGPVAAGA
jgi:Truncated hemoglobins